MPTHPQCSSLENHKEGGELSSLPTRPMCNALAGPVPSKDTLHLEAVHLLALPLHGLARTMAVVSQLVSILPSVRFPPARLPHVEPSSTPTSRVEESHSLSTENKVLRWHHPFYSLPGHCCFCMAASLFTSGPLHMLGFPKPTDSSQLSGFKSQVILSQRLPLISYIKLACPHLPKRLYGGTVSADLLQSINH